jgi:GTP cyclohydrolase IA
MENKRRKIYEDIEIAPQGYANGVAVGFPLSKTEKDQMIQNAAKAFGEFLDALRVDWRNDPNSMETPMRVAKKYVNEQWAGRYDGPPSITSFPSDSYDGLITECNIPLTSICSHHHETILGRVHISYIPSEEGRVIGLSKLNRLVEHFGRRGAIQEQLTMAIHQAVDKVCTSNQGIAVQIVASHQCVSCRGTNHQGASMVTTKLSGNYFTKPEVRNEFFDAIKSSHMLKQYLG